jgi:hypothetical protein
MKWADIAPQLSFFLDDNPATGEADYQFPLPLRIAGWNFAQNAFSSHTLRERTAIVTVTNRVVTLPDDFNTLGLLLDTGNKHIYSRMSLQEGMTFNEAMMSDYSYWMWSGKLFIENDRSSQLTMHYFADWPDVTFTVTNGVTTVVADDIYVPKWSLRPLFELVAAYCLEPNAIRAAMDRNYDIRIASGNPLMNSRQAQAREHAWWYDYLLSKIPPQARGVGVN